MTDREKAIVMAYTGICMLEGKKLFEFYKYLEELYERPVYTHEFLTLDIKERSEKDFMELCRREEPEQRWIPCSERLPEQDTEVLVTRKFLGVKDPCGGWHAHLRPETYVETARLLGKVWVSDSDEHKIAPSRHADPVAWMPLPESYSGE